MLNLNNLKKTIAPLAAALSAIGFSSCSSYPPGHYPPPPGYGNPPPLAGMRAPAGYRGGQNVGAGYDLSPENQRKLEDYAEKQRLAAAKRDVRNNYRYETFQDNPFFGGNGRAVQGYGPGYVLEETLKAAQREAVRRAKRAIKGL